MLHLEMSIIREVKGSSHAIHYAIPLLRHCVRCASSVSNGEHWFPKEWTNWVSGGWHAKSRSIYLSDCVIFLSDR